MKIKFHKFIKFFSICCLAPLPPIIGLTSCSSIKIADLKCEHNTVFGGCLIDIAPKEFERKGFTWGDTINITFSNNISFQNIPYFSNYIGYNKQFVAVPLINCLHVAQKNCPNDFWNIFNFTDDITTTISIAEKVNLRN